MRWLGKYIFGVLIAIDQLINALVAGNPDETISSRLGRKYPNSWFRHRVDDIFGRNHCKNAIEDTEENHF